MVKREGAGGPKGLVRHGKQGAEGQRDILHVGNLTVITSMPAPRDCHSFTKALGCLLP